MSHTAKTRNKKNMLTAFSNKHSISKSNTLMQHELRDMLNKKTKKDMFESKLNEQAKVFGTFMSGK
jgi:hypothetical protein